MSALHLFLTVTAGLTLVWLTLMAIRGSPTSAPNGLARREAMRLLPDVLRLLRRLAADRDLPRGVRVRLALLVGYRLLPIDLVPDFIPILDYADDALVAAIACAVPPSLTTTARAPLQRTRRPGPR